MTTKTKKPDCFGEWKDITFKGYPKCRKCFYLFDCMLKFKDDLDNENIKNNKDNIKYYR